MRGSRSRFDGPTRQSRRRLCAVAHCLRPALPLPGRCLLDIARSPEYDDNNNKRGEVDGARVRASSGGGIFLGPERHLDPGERHLDGASSSVMKFESTLGGAPCVFLHNAPAPNPGPFVFYPAAGSLRGAANKRRSPFERCSESGRRRTQSNGRNQKLLQRERERGLLDRRAIYERGRRRTDDRGGQSPAPAEEAVDARCATSSLAPSIRISDRALLYLWHSTQSAPTRSSNGRGKGRAKRWRDARFLASSAAR